MTKTKQRFKLVHIEARQRAIDAVSNAPDGFIVEVKEPTRSLDQNAKFHAICSDLSKSHMTWAGKQRTADQWKVLLVSGHSIATKETAEVVPGLEGEFINLRESTAKMGTQRASSLIEYAIAFCSMNEVKLKDAFN